MAQINSSFPDTVIAEVHKERAKEKRETSFSSMVCLLVQEALAARKNKKK